MDIIIENILWFDENVNSSENKEYLKKFETEFPSFFISAINEEQQLFDKIKSLKFKGYIIIISGRKFQIFIDYLLTKSINSIPILAIFTSNITSLKEKMDIKYKKYLYDKFYNPLGISDSISEISQINKRFFTTIEK